ncbi:MAG TPA: IPT/TIG domain-containing protein, partial [Vicinamibacterales bacterium]|nr:IPT/TIG domain-containing protein [Vicinamibacterales bacterium]
MTIRGVLSGLALAGLTLTACGGAETPSGPTNPPVVVGPTVLGISPGSGPASGGTTVTVSGANFAAGAAVSIGSVAATSVTVVSSTSITAVTGAHAAGAAGVTV